MNYKIQKYKKGNKNKSSTLDKDSVMEEARKNQAIEQAARMGNRTINIPQRNSTVQIIMPSSVAKKVDENITKEITNPTFNERNDLKSGFKTRGEAFNFARKQG